MAKKLLAKIFLPLLFLFAGLTTAIVGEDFGFSDFGDPGSDQPEEAAAAEEKDFGETALAETNQKDYGIPGEGLEPTEEVGETIPTGYEEAPGEVAGNFGEQKGFEKIAGGETDGEKVESKSANNAETFPGMEQPGTKRDFGGPNYTGNTDIQEGPGKQPGTPQQLPAGTAGTPAVEKSVVEIDEETEKLLKKARKKAKKQAQLEARVSSLFSETMKDLDKADKQISGVMKEIEGLVDEFDHACDSLDEKLEDVHSKIAKVLGKAKAVISAVESYLQNNSPGA